MVDQDIIIERLRYYADSFYGLPGQPQLLRLTEGQAELLAVDIRKVCNELERITCKLCGGTGKKAVGEHETLPTEWVIDYAPCNHKPPHDSGLQASREVEWMSKNAAASLFAFERSLETSNDSDEQKDN